MPSNEDPLANTDKNEILTLIDLLVLRVECLANESDGKLTNATYPTVSEVDQNLIEYLYYLFAQFLGDPSSVSHPTTPTMDKTNFVHVCQTLVRNGCFDLSTVDESLSPDQSSADTTFSSDRTLTQQSFLHESPSEHDTVVAEISFEQQPSGQDTWLVIDLEPTTSDDELANDESMVRSRVVRAISDERHSERIEREGESLWTRPASNWIVVRSYARAISCRE